jgi:hypothetical protein
MPDPTVLTRLLWIVLPNGVRIGANGRKMLRLSVRLAPRVTGATSLVQCPLFSGSDGSGTWADKARQCRFEVLVSTNLGQQWVDIHAHTSSPEPTHVVASDPTQPDPEVWRALFSDTLPIEPHTLPTPPSAQVQSYSVKAARDALVQPYRVSANDGPLRQQVITPRWTRLFPATPEAAIALRRFTLALQASHGSPSRAQIAAAAPTSGFSAGMLQMDNMSSFYDGLATGAKARYTAAAAQGFQQQAPQFDFHAAIAAASRYPALMRALGLVFDLELALDELVLPPTGWLRVRLAQPGLAGAPADKPVLATHYRFGPGDLFVAASRDDFATSDLDNGMLLLDSESDYCSVDVNLSELHHGVRWAGARAR